MGVSAIGHSAVGAMPQILFGRVMHKRLFPKVNAFAYGIYYIAVPLSAIDALPMPVDRFGLLAFHRKDHGACDGSDLDAWARATLRGHGIEIDGEIVLLTLPRVLGYVFNPVSFWFCRDAVGVLRAVLCEVNNTFGESHSYICAHADGRAIDGDEWLHGEKFFHVSPFLERSGSYRFRFALQDDALAIAIDHYAADGRKQLLTALTGTLEPMTKATLRRAFRRYPLVTMKAILLIHWQAARLVAKRIRYVPKPQQQETRLTVTGKDITNL